MLNVLLFVASPALAVEPAPFFARETLFPTDAVAKDKKGKGKDKKGDGKKKNDDEDEGKMGKILGMDWEPYVAPGGGVQIDSGGDMAVTAGADVGIRYWKKKLEGDLYAGAAYITGDNVAGYDVHLGDQTGYRDTYWGAGGGLEATYNGQSNITTGKDILAPALGVKIPVEVVVGPKKYYGKAGVAPAWYFEESRKANSGGAVPLGDEFEWFVKGGLKIDKFKAEIGFAQLITPVGTYNTPTLAVGYAP